MDWGEQKNNVWPIQEVIQKEKNIYLNGESVSGHYQCMAFGFVLILFISTHCFWTKKDVQEHFLQQWLLNMFWVSLLAQNLLLLSYTLSGAFMLLLREDRKVCRAGNTDFSLF